MSKESKSIKRKKQHKDWKKKNNILRQWQREQKNKQRSGLPLKGMPVDFPKSKK